MASEQIWIRQEGGSVQGPFPSERVTGWMRTGKVRPGMELSGDGQEWIPLTEDAMQELLAQQGKPEPTTRSRSGRTKPPLTKQQQSMMGCLGLVGILLVAGLVAKLAGCGPEKAEIHGKEATVTVKMDVPVVWKLSTTTGKISDQLYEVATEHPEVESLSVTLQVDKDDVVDEYGKNPSEDVKVGPFRFDKRDLDEARKFKDAPTYQRRMETIIAAVVAAQAPHMRKTLLGD
jgi:hypothetical protein